MNYKDIFQEFCDRKKSFVEGNKFNVSPIPGMKHKIGKSDEGYPKFFVLTDVGKSIYTNIIGEFLSVEYCVECNLIEESGQNTDAIYSIITLRSNDDHLQQIFIEVFLLMLSTLPEEPTVYDIAIKIEGLLSIFSSLKRKPIHKIQGLWAELLIILLSKNPSVVAKAWHNSPGAKYDFTMGTDKIEVKSTSSETRKHKFSLDQLNPMESSRLLVASVIVRESAKDENGLSVFDLYDKICECVSDIEIRIHIYTVIVDTLGSEYDKANDVYFDYASGKDSLAYYDYKDIPHILKCNVPEYVSEVKFVSDLTHIKTTGDNNLKFEEGSLLALV